jgi:hypothetical protein
LYINDPPQTTGVNLALFADDTCLYAAERKEGYVLRKFQLGLISVTWPTEQGEAHHRKYNGLKLGCGQVYNCSSG